MLSAASRAAPVACARVMPRAVARLGACGVHTEAKLEELGLELPPPGKAQANYILSVRSGDTIFTAGHLPMMHDGTLMSGKVGVDLNTEEAYAAAELVGLNILSTLKAELGDLDRVKRIVKLNGFVNCVDSFSAQPKVINGISDLFGKVFGARGVHARSALGTNALPLNVPVEIEAIVELYPGDEVAPPEDR